MNMFRSIVSIGILALLWAYVFAGDCVLNYNYQVPGIFLQPSYDGLTFIAPNNGEITVPNGDMIFGYCSTKFTNLDNTQFNGVLSNITFACSNGKLTYQPTPNVAPVAQDVNKIACQQEVLFYPDAVRYCQDTGLQYGLQIANVSISLAELCYNSATASPIFVHFILGERSGLLANQNLFNPLNLTPFVNHATFSFENLPDPTSLDGSLQSAIDAFAPLLSADIEYEFDGLAPVNLLSNMFIQYTANFNQSNLIPWWKPLKNGNWKAVMAALENLQASGIFDIYMGTSGIVVHPNSPFEEIVQPLIYQDGDITKTVPMNIWTWVKQRNTSDKGVVIIAVNTPFFDENGTNSLLCNDVCHNTEWLSSLLTTSHMPALGYVYCCHPDDVIFLNGFPQFEN